MIQPDHAIEAVGLVKTFGATRAVSGIDLRVSRGSIYGLLGPNGAGKTTMVRLLATLLRPDSGSARVLGHDVVREAVEVRRRISLTGQFASVDEDLTGGENLHILARLLGFSRSDATARTRELLAAFDIEDAADREIKTYSGGMRRRLDLAVSMIWPPEVLFLDEPTTGLDPAARTDFTVGSSPCASQAFCVATPGTSSSACERSSRCCADIESEVTRSTVTGSATGVRWPMTSTVPSSVSVKSVADCGKAGAARVQAASARARGQERNIGGFFFRRSGGRYIPRNIPHDIFGGT